MISIRAFRAIDNQEDNRKFADGHMQVLKIFGITMITSANTEWFTDPNTYVIVVESEDGSKTLGGARIQIAGGKFPLPIETAVCDHDSSIYEMVKQYSLKGTGEFCGLWNSREVAGLGIGSMFLGRVAVAITTQLKLTTLFGLCAPATVVNSSKIGFEIETRLGNNGTFYYPKEDLLATAVLIHDCVNLPTADSFERERIFDLRNNPRQKTLETVRKKEIEINYQIKIT